MTFPPLPRLTWFEVPQADLERAEAFFGTVAPTAIQRELHLLERVTLPQAVGGFGHFVDCERHRAGARNFA